MQFKNENVPFTELFEKQREFETKNHEVSNKTAQNVYMFIGLSFFNRMSTAESHSVCMKWLGVRCSS